MKTTTERLQEKDICILYRNDRILVLQYIGMNEENNYIFNPVYETTDILDEPLELNKDTVNNCIFIRGQYQSWPMDVLKAYTKYQLKQVSTKTSSIQKLSNNIKDKFKVFSESKEYNDLYESGGKLQEALDKIKEIIKRG